MGPWWQMPAQDGVGYKHAWKRSEQGNLSRHHQGRLCGGARWELKPRGQEVGWASRGGGVKAAICSVLCLPQYATPHALWMGPRNKGKVASGVQGSDSEVQIPELSLQ